MDWTCRCNALTGWPDVSRIDAGDLLCPADRAVIEHFLSHPRGWSAQHGGARIELRRAHEPQYHKHSRQAANGSLTSRAIGRGSA
jgi:hypothetical protein